MEFEMQYLTYEDYKRLGGTLKLLPFNLLEFESRRKIDSKTQNRLKNVEYENIPEEVKICMFKLINKMSSYDKNLEKIYDNGKVASENIDGYSVSYITSAQALEIINSKSAEIDNIIEEELLYVVVNNEHLLYCGVK